MLSPRRLPSEFKAARRMLMVSVGLGAMMGVFGFGLLHFIEFLQQLFLSDGLGLNPPGLASDGGVLQMFVTERAKYLPIVCGLLFGFSGWLYSRFNFTSKQSLQPQNPKSLDGQSILVQNFHQQKTEPVWRLASMGFMGILEIVVGTSAGLEGALTHLARVPLQTIGRLLQLKAEDEAWLGPITLAAILAVIFHAPIAAAVLAIEMLYKGFDFETEILAAALAASLCASTIATVLGLLFATPAHTFFMTSPTTWSFVSLVAAILIGIGIAASVWVLLQVATLLRLLVQKIKLPTWLIWAAAGLSVGTMLWQELGGLGLGFGWMQLALDGFLPWGDALRIAGWRSLALLVFLVLGSPAGRLTPSLVIGALFAYSLAGLANSFFGFGLDAIIFLWIGAATALAASARAPLGASVLMLEWGNFALLPPILLGIATAFNINRHGLLQHQPDDRATSMAHILEALSGACGMAINQHDLNHLPKTTNNGTLVKMEVPVAWRKSHLHEWQWPAGQTLLGVWQDGVLELPHEEMLLHQQDDLLVLKDFETKKQ